MGGQFRVNGLVKDAAGLGRVFVVDAASAGQAVGRREIGQGFGVLVSFVLLEEHGDVGGLFQAGRGDTTFWGLHFGEHCVMDRFVTGSRMSR